MSLGYLSYKGLPFGMCNSLTTFQREFLSIFVELVHDTVEIYMDEFTPYGCNFQEDLYNLCKVLNKFIEVNLSLSPEKCKFFMKEGSVHGHSISHEGMQVDPKKLSSPKGSLSLKNKDMSRVSLD